MSEKRLPTGRRQFLKGMVVTGGGAALAGIATSASATLERAPETPAKTGSQGYHETAHIREYYQKARF